LVAVIARTRAGPRAPSVPLARRGGPAAVAAGLALDRTRSKIGVSAFADPA